MSETQRTKDVVNSELQRVFNVGKAIEEEINNLPGDENTDKRQLLLNDLRDAAELEEALNNEFAKLVEQEKQPELERISSLRKELEKPITAPSSSYMGFAGYSGVGVGPQVYDTSQPSYEEQKARQREVVGELYNAPPSDGGRAAEQLPAGVRFGVGALPTPESELEYLKMQYPDARITPMSVGNSTEYLIKTKDNKTFTTLDMGLAGFGGAALVEAPIVAGSTAAGIAAALATKSPMAGTATAATTEAVLGTTADMITRAALGMPRNIGENVMRRGSQAAIGGALGVVGDVAIPAARAVRMPGGFANEFMQEYVEAAQRTGLPEAVPSGVQFGPMGLEGAQELAGDFPTSRLGGRLRKAQEDLRKIFDPFKAAIRETPGDYSAIALNQAKQREALVNSITQSTGQNKLIIDGAVDRLLTPAKTVNIDNLGKTLRESVLAAEEKVIKDKNQKYEDVLDLADQAGFSMSAKDLLNTVESMAASINRSNALNDSAIVGTMNRLQERVDAPAKLKFFQKYINSRTNRGFPISEADTKKLDRLKNLARPINSTDFEKYIQAFREARPDDPRAGTSKDVFGTQIASELSKYRMNVYSGLNANLPNGTTVNVGDLFRDASAKVNESKAFQENLLGSILKEAGGEQSMGERAIVNAVMQEPSKINRVLLAAQNLETADPSKVGITKNLQEMMQTQYLQDIGMGSQGNITRLNYDQGYLDTLFGPNSGRVARGLDTLNDNLEKLKGASVSNMTLTDLNQLSSALTKEERNRVASQIIKREAAKRQEQKLVTSKIYEAAEKGNFENIDPDLLSNSIYSDWTVGQVQTAMKQLNKISPEGRNLYRPDFLRILLDKYNGGVPSAGAPYTPLFDVDKFLVDYGSPKKPTELGKKINEVLGLETGHFLHDIAKLYQGNTIKELSKKDLNLRVVASTQALSVLAPVAKMTTTARNRFLAESLANGSGRYGLRAALARNALPGEVNDAYMKMFQGAFKTRQGVTSLVRMAEGDPEFSAELQQAAKDFEEQEKADFEAKSAELNRGADRFRAQQGLNPAPR